jgi:hypothetical protein
MHTPKKKKLSTKFLYVQKQLLLQNEKKLYKFCEVVMFFTQK